MAASGAGPANNSECPQPRKAHDRGSPLLQKRSVVALFGPQETLLANGMRPFARMQHWRRKLSRTIYEALLFYFPGRRRCCVLPWVLGPPRLLSKGLCGRTKRWCNACATVLRKRPGHCSLVFNLLLHSSLCSPLPEKHLQHVQTLIRA